MTTERNARLAGAVLWVMLLAAGSLILLGLITFDASDAHTALLKTAAWAFSPLLAMLLLDLAWRGNPVLRVWHGTLCSLALLIGMALQLDALWWHRTQRSGLAFYAVALGQWLLLLLLTPILAALRWRVLRLTGRGPTD